MATSVPNPLNFGNFVDFEKGIAAYIQPLETPSDLNFSLSTIYRAFFDSAHSRLHPDNQATLESLKLELETLRSDSTLANTKMAQDLATIKQHESDYASMADLNVKLLAFRDSKITDLTTLLSYYKKLLDQRPPTQASSSVVESALPLHTEPDLQGNSQVLQTPCSDRNSILGDPILAHNRLFLVAHYRRNRLPP